ncbi:hypothetical protein ACP275_11G034900 [Erythranthe tilingii]
MTVEEIRGDGDNFPVGLRVLAVDDDPICLKLLETLLRKCQYHVTTTSQARMALKMLRENKDRFDLVISDVHMPDMDGFKLLEYVGLEMDLPVIMLSANGDPKLVMKGVTHGACDYLVKPVRIEELRNIWQHVLRRKKCDNKNPKKSSGQVKSHQTNGEGGLGSPLGNADQNGKFNRKRKEDEDESEDNENDEDPSTQKKPRVVWSIELHRKFVGAVNQLGIEKAVPKRILDLMNVDGLTRENVASHLQKYRLYLKRISSAASQQAHMAAAFGVKDSPFMHHMGSLDGLGDFRTLSSARLPNVVLSPYTTTTTNGMLGRLNSPSANVSLRNLSPSVGPLQPSQAQNLSSSIASLNKMNFGTQNTSLFQGIPSHLEQNATNNNCNGVLGTSNFNAIDEILNGASFNPEPFDASGAFGSSNPLLSSTEAFHSQLPLVNGSRRNDASLNGAYLNTDFSSGVGLVGGEVHNMNYGNNIFGSLNSSNISGNGIVSRLGRSLGQNNPVLNQRMDGFVNGRSSVSGGSNLLQPNEIEKPVNELRQRSDEDSFILEETRLNAGFVPQSYDSLDELVNAMIKREQDETVSNCEFQFDDDYAFGNGI